MRAKSKKGSFATKIEIQQVEVFLTTEDLYTVLAGNNISVYHQDETSPAKFYIILKKEKDLP